MRSLPPIVLAPVLFLAVGCAPQATTPFHVYGSPMLRATTYTQAQDTSRTQAALSQGQQEVYALENQRMLVRRGTAAARRPKRSRATRRAPTPTPRAQAESVPKPLALATRASAPASTRDAPARRARRAAG